MGAKGAELTELAAGEAARLIRTKQLSSVELIEACIGRIEEREGTIGAWAYLDLDLALEQARRCDSSEPKGLLHGVPVAVKDLIDTGDMPTSYGSPIYLGHQPAQDAACVALLRASGAVILGKTVTTEFALFHAGRTVNPNDTSRTPGGSSSGSAAAVADRMVPLALGTQTAGSIVRPASFCGIFGHKPTFGTIDRTGTKSVSPTLDTLGLFARNPEDLALLASILMGGSERSSSLSKTPSFDMVEGNGSIARIGFCRTHQWEAAEPDTKTIIESAISRVDASNPITEIDLPTAFDGLAAAQELIQDFEAARSLATEYRTAPDLLSPRLLDLIESGAQISETVYLAALDLASECRQRLEETVAGLDFLIAPAVTGEAPRGLESTGDPLFCRMWTLLGTPTVAVPGLTGPSGLPLGIQVIALPQRDDVANFGAAWLWRSLSKETDDSPT